LLQRCDYTAGGGLVKWSLLCTLHGLTRKDFGYIIWVRIGSFIEPTFWNLLASRFGFGSVRNEKLKARGRGEKPSRRAVGGVGNS
jgi:hypothetical protein